MAERKVFSLFLLMLIMAPLALLSVADKAPAMFVFGDSLIDNGNNNFIPSIARANYFPYGIDFGAPTGRFCNGLTVSDFAAKNLGLESPEPYLSLWSSSPKIMHGANYASAAAGILDETGQHYGTRMAMNAQIKLFEKTVLIDLCNLIPDRPAMTKHISDSLFIIIIGSNDYINNYLLPKLYPSSRNYDTDSYADLLISNLRRQIEELHRLGARKMVLGGIGPLGCIPSQMAAHNSTGGCVESVNKLAQTFNRRLKLLVSLLPNELKDSSFVYHDAYNTFYDMIHNPAKYGFTVTDQACCGIGRFGGALTCLPMQKPCEDRNQYLFWDAFHPTEAANDVVAEKCYSSDATDCYPISGLKLADS